MFSEKVLQARQELIEARRYLHAHAELSFQETETTQYLVRELEKIPGVTLLLIVLLIDRLGENLRMIIDPYSAQE